MIETDELRIFVAVVAASSVSRAATELRVPRATVSRKLAALEERLGARLLQRTTRSMQLTDAGRAFHVRAAAALDAVRLAEASVATKSDTPEGDVRVSIPPMVGGGLPDLLADFAHEHPRVCLHVHVSNRRVDLAREPFDVAIRASATLDPGLTVRRLARVALVGVASPAYLAEHGTPQGSADLARHRCLLGLDPGGAPVEHWRVAGKRRAMRAVAHSNDPHLVLRWVLRGLGIAVLPATLVAPGLARGELVSVLPSELRTEGSIALVTLERTLVSPAVRAFVAFVSKRGPAALRSVSAAG